LNLRPANENETKRLQLTLGHLRCHHPQLAQRIAAVTTSRDFIHWTQQQWTFPPETPVEHLYTNAATPYFRAPHIWVGFPMRYFPERTVVTGWISL